MGGQGASRVPGNLGMQEPRVPQVGWSQQDAPPPAPRDDDAARWREGQTRNTQHAARTHRQCTVSSLSIRLWIVSMLLPLMPTPL